MGFSVSHLGHAPGLGGGGGGGGGGVNLFLNSPQIWCVSYSHVWDMKQHILIWPRPLGPWGEVKYH